MAQVGKLALALVTTFGIFFVGGCLYAQAKPKMYTTPSHPHKRYTFAVTHNGHVAFYTDHHFAPKRWPIACSIQATDGKNPWYASESYLTCPVCGEYVSHSVLSWGDLQAQAGPPQWRGEIDFSALVERKPPGAD